MDRDLLGLSSSLAFVDEIYEKLEDGIEVDPSWRAVIESEPRKGNGHGKGKDDE